MFEPARARALGTSSSTAAGPAKAGKPQAGNGQARRVMSSRTGTYGAALRATMRTTAAAYGYTLSTAASIGVLTQLAGKPDTGRLLLLFALGGVTAFAVLEALLAAVRPLAPQPPSRPFPSPGRSTPSRSARAWGWRAWSPTSSTPPWPGSSPS